MTALYHDHRTDQNRSGGTLLGANGSDQSHSRGYGRSTLAGRAELLTNPNTRPDRAFTRSGHFGVVEPRLYSLGEPPSRTAGRRSRIVTWALPQTGPRARPLDAGYFRQGLVPATSFRRGWGCSPARLAEFRARLAAGLRQEQVDALLSDPVDHLPCRDTDLPERHNQKSLCAVGRSVTINSEVNDGAVQWLTAEIGRHRANGTEFHGVYSDALEHLARVVRGDAGAVETPTDGGTGE